MTTIFRISVPNAPWSSVTVAEVVEQRSHSYGLIFVLRGEIPNVPFYQMRDVVGGSEVYPPTHPLHLIEVGGPWRYAASLVSFDGETFTVKTYESTRAGLMPLF